MRLDDDRVIAPTVAARRCAARVLFAQGLSRRLLAFRVADTHIHAELQSTRAVAGRFANYAQAALRKHLKLPVPFSRARIRPILDQGHLYNTFRYVLRQEERHGLSVDTTHDASSLPDLLGMRTVGRRVVTLVREQLPRIDRIDLMRLLRVDLDFAEPAFDALADAAAAAAGLTNLAGRGALCASSRAAACHVAVAAGHSPQQVASWLGVDARSVQRLLKRAPDAGLARAVDLQLRLRGALRSAEETTFASPAA